MTSPIVAKQRQPARRVACALSIAGSDSSGGAGIQADLRTFAALGIHGLSAITAITAQNSAQVRSVHRIPGAHLRNQLETLAAGFQIAAVKIGMLGSKAAIETVARFLREHPCPAVLDPVLMSSSGVRLLPASAIGALRSELIPLVQVLTPNLPEAAALMPRLESGTDARAMAQELLALGARSVLLKGGHATQDPVCDYLAAEDRVRIFRHPRLPYAARGTGCTLASAIAAYLAHGRSISSAVEAAERYLQRALRAAYVAERAGVRLLGPLTRR
jgi:hydroxymethylpyrimidine/phosphomethylpyrimidine kinase